MKHSHRTRAFTLVVVAVIGILISILLPAANYAREAARRIQRMNNMRQRVIGLNNYEASQS